MFTDFSAHNFSFACIPNNREIYLNKTWRLKMKKKVDKLNKINYPKNNFKKVNKYQDGYNNLKEKLKMLNFELVCALIIIVCCFITGIALLSLFFIA